MKAKRNRYDLSLWDVRKLQLYGRAMESVQVEAIYGRANTSARSRNPDLGRSRRARISSF